MNERNFGNPVEHDKYNDEMVDSWRAVSYEMTYRFRACYAFEAQDAPLALYRSYAGLCARTNSCKDIKSLTELLLENSF